MRLSISIYLSLSLVTMIALFQNPAHAATHPTDFAGLIAQQSEATGVPSNLIEAVITVESGWRSTALNGSSIGLMQITPGTATLLGFRGPVKDLFNPETNIRLGVSYLAMAYKLAEGDLCATVPRYQSGLEATRPNAANRAYCKKMKALLASS